MRLWLVRHGETEWSRSGRHTGRSDPPLTPAGAAQAEALGDWIRTLVPAPSTVLSSPLARAVETCRLAGYANAMEIAPDLCEWDYGDYEGRTTEEIRTERPGWTLWTDGVPHGESAAQVGRRADRVIDRVRATGADALVFAHGHLLRVLAARWVGLPPAAGRLLALGAGSVSMLDYERETPVVGLWNSRAPAR